MNTLTQMAGTGAGAQKKKRVIRWQKPTDDIIGFSLLRISLNQKR